MAAARDYNLKTQKRRLKRRLPNRAAAAFRWLETSSAWLRWPAGLLLLVAGCFGFLPILGFWMIPLGLLLIVQDLPFLRPPLARLFAFINKKLPT